MLLPSLARGQQVESAVVHAELRADAIIDQTRAAAQLGVGAQIPAGYYARIAVVGAVGTDVSARAGTDRGLNGRIDVLGRFLLDPFRQTRWGLSAGAGVSLRAQAGQGVRPYLVALIDLEGPLSARGVSPALQVGLGGGVRVGVALRRGEARER